MDKCGVLVSGVWALAGVQHVTSQRPSFLNDELGGQPRQKPKQGASGRRRFRAVRFNPMLPS